MAMFSMKYKTAIAAVGLFGAVSVANANELKVVGTGDGLEMLKAVAVVYSARNPKVRINLPPSIGSGGGILAVGSQTERLGRVARPLKPTEVKFGLEYIPIARIPSAILVHKSTGITHLTSKQLRRIYSGEVRSWAEFGGADMKIKVVRREEADSTLAVLRASMPGWSNLKITDRSKTAVTTQDALNTVRRVPGAIGFGPYSRALDFEVNVLKIDGKAPTDPDYPSAVVLALIYKNGKIDADTRAFVDFCLSSEAAQVISNYGGVPLGG